MQGLPVYQPESQAHGLSIQRRRDTLVERAEAHPQAFRDALDTLALECVRETLCLTGVETTLRDVHLAAAGKEPKALVAGGARLVQGQIEALRLIEKASRRERTPSVDLLCAVHRLSSPSSSGALRGGPGRSQFGNARPSPPALVAERVANLFEWLGAESGRGMFPAERAGLTLARLLEIAPFEQGNFRTAHLMLSFFSLADGYPPLFLCSEEADSVRQEIERAMVFDTRPLVDRLAGALSRALAFCEQSLPLESRA